MTHLGTSIGLLHGWNRNVVVCVVCAEKMEISVKTGAKEEAS